MQSIEKRHFLRVSRLLLLHSVTSARSEDKSLNFDGCLWWLRGWKQCPTHTVAEMFELYEQLLPTRLRACQKTHTDTMGEVMCRLCNNAPESVARVLAGCTALAQTKYTTRHNAALAEDPFLRDFARLRPCSLGTYHLGTRHRDRNQCTSRTTRRQSGTSLYSRSTKKLEPTEWMHALSTTCQSESSR